jgi:hypothetical protein
MRFFRHVEHLQALLQTKSMSLTLFLSVPRSSLRRGFVDTPLSAIRPSSRAVDSVRSALHGTGSAKCGTLAALAKSDTLELL